jgi:hypothetical protein
MPKVGKDAVELTASLTTIYTVPANSQTTLIELLFLNKDNSDRIVTVHFVPTGGSADNTNTVIKQQSTNAIQPGHTEIYRFNQFLNAGDTIQWKADAASQVTARVSILEEVV